MSPPAPSTRFIRLKDVVVDRDRACVLREGEVHRLEPRVLALLNYLLQHPGRTVSREELIKTVWMGTHVVDEAVMRSVSLLRQALGDDAKAPAIIESVTKRGYRLKVEPIPVSEPAPEPSRLRWREARGWIVAALILAFTLGVMTGCVLWEDRRKPLKVVDLATGEVSTLR